MHTRPGSFDISLGERKLTTAFPAGTVELVIREPEMTMTGDLFCLRLERFLQENPLDLSRPAIVVTDKTRLCDYPTYLPLLIKTLVLHGMRQENLRFIIAYGTHLPQSDEASRKLYGSTFDDFPFLHHDCDEADSFMELGTTSRGTPIRFRRDLMEASAVITMGPIVHHYFAGYGGGRKLLFPGCGERQAIYANHGLFLDSAHKTLASHCQPGIVEKNPLAEDLHEIAEKKPADLAIHGILDSHGNIADMLIGNSWQEYTRGCDIHGRNCEVESGRFDLVIASAGGFPKDINFIQSHKAIHNAAMFVNDGGLLIIYSECRESIGSTSFLPWFEMKDYGKAFATLSCAYEGNGGTALSMMNKLKRIRIGMVTSLDQQLCDLIGVEKYTHQSVQHLLNTTDVPPAWIANASLLVKKN